MKLSTHLGSAKTRLMKRKGRLVWNDGETKKNENILNVTSPSRKNKQNDRKKDEKLLEHSSSEGNKSTESSVNTSKCDGENLNTSRIDCESVENLNFIKKRKKNKINPNQNIQESGIRSSNDSIRFATNSLSCFNDEKIETFHGIKSNMSQIESCPLRNEKKQKIIDETSNENSKDVQSVSDIECTTNNTDLNLSSKSTSIADNISESTEKVSLRKKRKRKSEFMDENCNESESITSNNDSTVSTEHLKPDALAVTEKTSEFTETTEKTSLKKAKKKKRKLDKNTNVSKPFVLANAAENASSTLDSTPKPLKSCLKKKKRKNKKKKNQSKLKSNEESFEDEKKLSNRSVSFDSNVKIELIENCLSKSTNEKAPSTQNNDRKKMKALAYLKCWKEDKQNWKFEKLTQLWLLKNMYQEDMVPGKEFDCLLEYLVDLKGAARSLVINLCEKIVSKKEQTSPHEENKELEIAYRRARSVLQYLE